MKKSNTLIAFVFTTIAALTIGLMLGYSAGKNYSKPQVQTLAAESQTGFDEFGYNYQARVFVGAADGVDRSLDGKVWGDPTYAKDHLVMKWSKGWDDARFHGGAWGPEAWEDNEWNGSFKGASGETAHYKIIWVGSQLDKGPYWRPGGYAIWGQFEVIMDQGRYPGANHTWFAHANPTGYGAK